MSFNRNYPFTEEKFDRWTKQGRGTGAKEFWLPWLTEADLPPRFGHKTRYASAICPRVGIALSSIEVITRSYYEFVSNVDDVREQFPLDREQTRRIARKLGIKHPCDPDSRVDIVMTTDLVVSLKEPDGSFLELPRSCKSHTRVHDFNQAEHAEIERRYWADRGRNWRMVTDSARSMPPVLRANLELMHKWRFPPEAQAFNGYFEGVCERLIASVLAYQGDATLQSFGQDYQARNGLKEGEAINALLYLIYRHRLCANVTIKSLLEHPVRGIADATETQRQDLLRSAA